MEVFFLCFKPNLWKGSEKDQEVTRRLTLLYLSEITVTLAKIDREIVLLYKTIEFIRNLENKLGNPMNSYKKIVNVFINYIKFRKV